MRKNAAYIFSSFTGLFQFVCNHLFRILEKLLLGSARLPVAAALPVGTAGSALIVVAYFLNQNGQLASTDWRFPALNLAGAALILFSLMFSWNLPSVLMEAFWVAISLYGLARARRA